MAAPGAWLPRNFGDFGNFIELLGGASSAHTMANSVAVSAITVASNVLFSSLAGYALAKIPFHGSRLVFGCILAAMMIPYIALFVPSFFIIVQLGMVNTIAGIVLPIVVMPIAVFIMRRFAPGRCPTNSSKRHASMAPESFGSSPASFCRWSARLSRRLPSSRSSTPGILPVAADGGPGPGDVHTAGGVGHRVAGRRSIDYGLLLAGAIVVLLPGLDPLPIPPEILCARRGYDRTK